MRGNTEGQRFDMTNCPVGARVQIRDAEWRIKQVDPVREGGVLLTCTGISNFVKGKTARFLTRFEEEVRLLLPEETRLVQDKSPGFRDSKLYLEALVRTAPVTDNEAITVGRDAVLDTLPYQFDPALQALRQPRCRILIADAVGIGKTLEAGILTAELIVRGRGKRILVLTTKAMLIQFQQEFWNRFSIPLVRLDSAGIQRVRNRLPSNQNPFHYFDRAIISIDTLKQSEYRDYLEKANWDIIIIDEAHNVAVRSNRSQRSRLAKLLSNHSDSLIMLSATPHDGKAESFSSLLNMLDPMALRNTREYTVGDFAKKGLVIRRFKHHIRSQVEKDFQEREIATVEAEATPEETEVFKYLSDLTFDTLDMKSSSGAHLFATTLTKIMFSSPAACLSTIDRRIEKLKKSSRGKAEKDAAKLKTLRSLVEKIGDDHFSKLGELVKMIGDGRKIPSSLGWDRNDPEDRLVIFTESVVTLQYLEKVLPQRCGLKKGQYIAMSGAKRDVDIMADVAEFNRKTSPVRLLLCSDVASEGINLHHLSHRMIHFDIPWSLMTFQQRNGRIDRYGQTKKPQIRYLQTVARIEKSIGDAEILKKLIEKDANAQKNIDDPGEFFLTQKEQEDRTAAQMEGRELKEDSPEDGSSGWLLEILASAEAPSEEGKGPDGISPVMDEAGLSRRVHPAKTIYKDDFDFAVEALKWINETDPVKMDANMLEIEASGRIFLQPPPDLMARLRYLPSEVLPEGGRFELTSSPADIEEEIAHARAEDNPWPAKQYLWHLHPITIWLRDRMLSIFGRHSAPVLVLPTLDEDEVWILLQGGFPNRRGYIPVHEWIAVQWKNGEMKIKDQEDLIDETGLAGELPNAAGEIDVSRYAGLLKEAVQIAAEKLKEARSVFEKTLKQDLEARTQELKEVLEERERQIDLFYKDREVMNRRQIDQKKKELGDAYESAVDYIKNTYITEEEPYLQLAAVVAGSRSRGV